MSETIQRQRMWVLLLLIGAVWACGGSGARTPPVGEDDPHLPSVGWADDADLDEDGVLVLDFGEIPLNRLHMTTVSLKNVPEGVSPLVADDLGAPFFAMVAVDGRRGTSVTFTFAPTAPGTFAAEGSLLVGDVSLPFRLAGSAKDEGTCEFTVEPQALRFTVGEEEPGLPATGQVSIRAIGSGGCTVENVRVVGDGDFSVESSQSVFISAGSGWSIPVWFQPRAGASATLLLEVEGEEVLVPLGTSPEATCAQKIEPGSPSSVNVGCGETSWGKVRNTCDNPLSATSVVFAPDAPVAASLSTSRLSPKSEAALLVSFDDFVEGGVSGAFVVSFDNGDRLYFPVEVEYPFEERVLKVPQESTYALFVIDNSVAMAPFKSDLQALAKDIADSFSWYRDPHIAVTTTSLDAVDGCGGEAGGLVPLDGQRPQIVTAEVANLKEVLTANFDVGTCAPQGLGAGLEAAKRALDHFPPAEIDEDTFLSVTFITAESDFSPDSLDHYEEELRSKGVNRVGLVSPGEDCEGLGFENRYASFTSRFYGKVVPLCRPAEWRRLDTLPFPLPFYLMNFPFSFYWYLEPHAIDWSGDGYIDERDGFQLLLDGAPLSDTWYTLGRSLTLDPYGLSPRSHIEIRYPATCTLSRADSPYTRETTGGARR